LFSGIGLDDLHAVGPVHASKSVEQPLRLSRKKRALPPAKGGAGIFWPMCHALLRSVRQRHLNGMGGITT